MEIMKRASEWASNPMIKKELRDEIQKLINELEYEHEEPEKPEDPKDSADGVAQNHVYLELKERFYKELEFGTGGLRGPLGAGLNRVNEVTISRVACALSQIILSETKNMPHKRTICVSYDSRQFSEYFSKIITEVFAGHGIKTFLMSDMNPVPVLSYSIRYHGAIAGAMITASHNPPNYNGFKIYWDDGAQVIAPYDQKIIQAYMETCDELKNLSEIKRLPFETACNQGLVQMVGDEFLNDYHQKIKSTAPNLNLCQEEGHRLGIVYTPIHGAALKRMIQVLGEYGFTNTHIVKEQAAPDGLFPTVKSPNPENPEALHLACELMKKENCDVAFGTDPDGDRLGVAVMHRGEIFYPNGNQIGLLMLEYILRNLTEKNKLASDAYFIKTIVTTPLQEKIAKSFGVTTYNTLTGFKWICGKMRDIEREKPNAQFTFATEESFGFLTHPFARDKDGISAGALMAEIALDLKLKGKTLIDGLDDIYERHGFSHEDLLSLDYFGIEGNHKIGRIMEWFRNHNEANLFGQKLKLKEDYELQKKFYYQNKTDAPINDLPKSNVLAFTFESEDRLMLRPSGTEPKIKFYIMSVENNGELHHKKQKSFERTNFIKQNILDLVENI